MWSPARQLQRVCAPLLQAAAAAPKLSASVTGHSVWLRSCHLLAVAMLRKPLSAMLQQSQRIAAPTAATETDAICGSSACGSPMLQQTAGFKLKSVLKRRCKDCYFVVRENRMHVICKTHPRHKQMAIVKPAKSTWILTHATQSPVRPW